MKKFILTFAIVLSLSALTSCTVEELEQPENSQLNKTRSQVDKIDNNERIGINISLDSISLNLLLEIDPPKPYPKPE
jgi:predicted small lipoprotein YifL